ncbi:FLYWCH-type domain-containing protein [Aphis craccivora]|uniref:FLYWCH-type domain-containing protein n=1 Tax=Aphis craccivora TaxID=307492 RepID=A0A6G0WM20_APHCR|nr:FLYWCH-type domain-containing protein [Aphis craccivora]
MNSLPRPVKIEEKRFKAKLRLRTKENPLEPIPKHNYHFPLVTFRYFPIKSINRRYLEILPMFNNIIPTLNL